MSGPLTPNPRSDVTATDVPTPAVPNTKAELRQQIRDELRAELSSAKAGFFDWLHSQTWYAKAAILAAMFIAFMVLKSYGVIGQQPPTIIVQPAPVSVMTPPPTAEAQPKLVDAVEREQLGLGHRIVAEHFRRLASRQLQRDGFAVSGGDKTPKPAKDADELVDRLSDVTVIGGMKSFGAFDQVGDAPGPVLGFIQKVFQWIRDHPEQVAAIIKFLLSLLMLFGDPVAVHFDLAADSGSMCITAVYDGFVVMCVV